MAFVGASLAAAAAAAAVCLCVDSHSHSLTHNSPECTVHRIAGNGAAAAAGDDSAPQSPSSHHPLSHTTLTVAFGDSCAIVMVTSRQARVSWAIEGWREMLCTIIMLTVLSALTHHKTRVGDGKWSLTNCDH